MKILLWETKREHFSHISQSMWNIAEPQIPNSSTQHWYCRPATISADTEYKINNASLVLNDFLPWSVKSYERKQNKDKRKDTFKEDAKQTSFPVTPAND